MTTVISLLRELMTILLLADVWFVYFAANGGFPIDQRTSDSKFQTKQNKTTNSHYQAPQLISIFPSLNHNRSYYCFVSGSKDRTIEGSETTATSVVALESKYMSDCALILDVSQNEFTTFLNVKQDE